MTPWSIFGGSGDLLRKFQSEFVDVEIFEIKHIMSHSFTRYTKHDIRNFAPAILNISLDISVYRISCIGANFAGAKFARLAGFEPATL